MNFQASRRLVRSIVAAAGCAVAASVNAQVVNWNTTDGVWSNPANWNPASVPNAASALVVVATPGTYTMGIDISPIVGSLTLSNLTGKAAVYNNSFLYIQGAGGIVNDSTITVNPTEQGNSTGIRFDVNAPLLGSGSLILNADTYTLETAVLANSNGAIITQGPGHSIHGTGRVLAAMNNAGTIAADKAGRTLELAVGAKTNSGVLKAAGGGVLAINNSITQTGTGLIEADAGYVNIGGYTISNGLIDAKNVGLVRTLNSTFNSVVATGPIDIPNSYSLSIAGTGFTHDGVLTINPTEEGNGTMLQYNIPGSLAGTGSVSLNATSYNLDTAYIISLADSLITQESAHTIRGTGRIYAPMTNNGTVVADRPGRALQLLSKPKTNNNIMRATNGGYLDIDSILITQASAASITADAGTFRMFNASVSRGHISATSGGQTQVINATLNDVTIDGTTYVPNNCTLAVTGSALANNGTITINPTAEGNGTLLRYESNALLTGIGTVALNASPSNLDTAYISTAGTVCTQDVNHTIRGTGRISASLINNGTIAADVQDRTLELFGNPKVNNALIKAMNGAVLWINCPLSQGPSGLVRVDSATLGIGGTTVSGGQINTTGTGIVRVYGATFDSVSSTAPIEIPNNNALYLTGAFTHNGTITINPTEEGNGTYIRFDSSMSLLGSGDIVLKASGSNLDTATLQTAATNVLTLPVTQTIRGTGSIHGAVTNNGLISADRNGRTLRLATYLKTNNATIKATGGGLLLVDASVANAQGQFIADAGNIVFEAVTISGGQVHALNAGGVSVWGTTFTDVTSDASIQVINSQSMYVQGSGFTNNGSITINPTSEGNATALEFNNGGLLGGSGQVILNANGFNFDTAVLHSNSAIPITIGPAQAVRGHGHMFGNFILQGKLAPGISGGPTWHILTDSGSIIMLPTASVDIDIQSASQWDRLAGTDSFTLNGTLNLTFAYTPSGVESFDLITGAAITGQFAAVNINGAPSRGMAVVYTPTTVRLVPCYANCDQSSSPPMLNANDFQCFMNRYTQGDPYVNCDLSTSPPVLNVNDFICFMNKFAIGCGG